MSGLSITGFGFDELSRKLEGMGPAIQKEAGKLILDGANRVANLARELAPADKGILRNLIVAEKDGDFGASVESRAEYSAYQEWGTGESVNIAINEDERAYEATFKTGKETKGHFARPFLFPALYEVTPSIIEDVNAMLQEEANR